VSWGYLREVPKLPRVPRAESPGRFLSEKEADALLRAAATVEDARWLSPLLLAALHTGARRGELLGLQWRDINFERKLVSIERGEDGGPTKGKAFRPVPLTAVLATALRSWKAASASKAPATARVFSVDSRELRRAWERAPRSVGDRASARYTHGDLDAATRAASKIAYGASKEEPDSAADTG